jgi:iron complex outermembrane receptor protein
MNGRIRCTMKSTIASAIALMVLVWAAPMAQAQAKAAFDLPAQPLADSLRAVGSQTNINLLFDPPLVAGRKAPALKAEVTADEALTRLLVGTGIKHEFLNETTIVLAKADAVGSKSSGAGASSSATSAEPGKAVPKEGQKSADSFRVAQADQGTHSQSSPVRGDVLPSQQSSTSAISEIIVTAQKRDQRLQDVPVPMSVISADALVNSNQPRLQDYYTSIPGLTVTPNVGSEQILSIRGITTGAGTNPTVGITVDDVPYGSSTDLGGGQVVPDFDPGDLARVEVLRGPQGTLYGASSMGGLIKFMTVDPSAEGLTGRVQAGTSSVHNGAELGYNFRGSINIPIGDTFAIRASALTRQDPGYIDNPVLHINGINEEHVNGGRLSALWRPSDAVSLNLSALYQDTKGDGSNDIDVQAGLGDLQQNYLRGVGGYDRKVQAYSATLKVRIGDVDLTSVSGYNVNSFSDSVDDTYHLSALTLKEFGVTGAPITEDNKTDKFTEEVRLSGVVWRNVDWLLGGFYTHESSQFVQNILAENPPTGAIVGTWGSIGFPTTYSEYAAFTDLTFHITDRLNVQIGGRESFITQTSMESNIGQAYDTFFLGAPSPVIYPEQETKANAFTYLVTPQYKVSSNLMVYARLASGYRAGGPNAAPGVPRQYDPDKTQNYEVGAKGDIFNHALSVDASLYYIDWKHVQVELLDPTNFQYYNGNGGGAKSQGVELSADVRPLTGLTISAWGAWNQAELTDAFPLATRSVYGADGDRLPYSSRFSGDLSLQQEFSLGKDVKGFVKGSVSYTGNRLGPFVSVYGPPQRQTLPAYAKTDLLAGIRHDSWTANVFVNNVADRRGVLAGGLGNTLPFAFTYIQPRTAGLSIAKEF